MLTSYVNKYVYFPTGQETNKIKIELFSDNATDGSNL